MRAPDLLTYKTRLQGRPIWDLLGFLLNGFVFILIGLQLPEVLGMLSRHSLSLQVLVRDALLISLAIVLICILWVFSAAYLPRLIFSRLVRQERPLSWRNVMLVAWTGMRGVVSLAAAQAVLGESLVGQRLLRGHGRAGCGDDTEVCKMAGERGTEARRVPI